MTREILRQREEGTSAAEHRDGQTGGGSGGGGGRGRLRLGRRQKRRTRLVRGHLCMAATLQSCTSPCPTRPAVLAHGSPQEVVIAGATEVVEPSEHFRLIGLRGRRRWVRR